MHYILGGNYSDSFYGVTNDLKLTRNLQKRWSFIFSSTLYVVSDSVTAKDLNC